MNGKCRKTDFKSSEHTMAVSWQWYFRSTQKTLQSGKKRMANAVKPVKKPANTHFRRIFATRPWINENNLKSANKRTANVVKPI